MRITELFASIQGESTLQGLPCVFVRFAGCNLNCLYCDAPQAQSGGAIRSLDEVIAAIKAFGVPFVCITGGEPLLQAESFELMERLYMGGYRVSLETNGSVDAHLVPRGVIRVFDVKCPGSGAEGSFTLSNLDDRRTEDQYKFVVMDRRDFTFACSFIREYELEGTAVLVSPVTPTLSPALLASWLIEELPWARLNLQLHKWIWPEDIASGIPR